MEKEMTRKDAEQLAEKLWPANELPLELVRKLNRARRESESDH